MSKKFNPNITACNHPGCIVSAKGKVMKMKAFEDHRAGLRPVKVRKSRANGGAPFINMAYDA
jgi:hypothetical protein